MFENEEEPKDWEIEEEAPPKRLEEKWAKEEYESEKQTVCPACKQEIPSGSFQCLYCGEQVFYESGLLGKLLKWFKKLFHF